MSRTPKDLIEELGAMFAEQNAPVDARAIAACQAVARGALEQMAATNRETLTMMANMHTATMAQNAQLTTLLASFMERHADRHLVLKDQHAARTDRGFENASRVVRGGGEGPQPPTQPRAPESPGGGFTGPQPIRTEKEYAEEMGISYEEIISEGPYGSKVYSDNRGPYRA